MKMSLKTKSIFCIICYVFSIILIGLIIFGIVILCTNIISKLAGGLIVGISLFFLFILFVNPTFFILYDLELKHYLISLFKNKKGDDDNVKSN